MAGILLPPAGIILGLAVLGSVMVMEAFEHESREALQDFVDHRSAEVEMDELGVID